MHKHQPRLVYCESNNVTDLFDSQHCHGFYYDLGRIVYSAQVIIKSVTERERGDIN
jgi:hypothetical protein